MHYQHYKVYVLVTKESISILNLVPLMLMKKGKIATVTYNKLHGLADQAPKGNTRVPFKIILYIFVHNHELDQRNK